MKLADELRANVRNFEAQNETIIERMSHWLKELSLKGHKGTNLYYENGIIKYPNEYYCTSELFQYMYDNRKYLRAALASQSITCEIKSNTIFGHTVCDSTIKETIYISWGR